MPSDWPASKDVSTIPGGSSGTSSCDRRPHPESLPDQQSSVVEEAAGLGQLEQSLPTLARATVAEEPRREAPTIERSVFGRM
jgi:hypothetical protein